MSAKIISMDDFINRKIDEKLGSAPLVPLRLVEKDGKIFARPPDFAAPADDGWREVRDGDMFALVRIHDSTPVDGTSFFLCHTACGKILCEASDIAERLFGQTWVRCQVTAKNIVTGEKRLECGEFKIDQKFENGGEVIFCRHEK